MSISCLSFVYVSVPSWTQGQMDAEHLDSLDSSLSPKLQFNRNSSRIIFCPLSTFKLKSWIKDPDSLSFSWIFEHLLENQKSRTFSPAFPVLYNISWNVRRDNFNVQEERRVVKRKDFLIFNWHCIFAKVFVLIRGVWLRLIDFLRLKN